MSLDKKISLLIERKQKIDRQINQLKIQNTETLAKALANVSEIENLDTPLILGTILESIKNISNLSHDQQEVLRNSGKSFLKKFKILPTKTPKAAEK